jgi:VWFA-related protein
MRSILVVSAVVLAASLAAQEPQVFDDTIDVRVVNVETVVTDGKGRPVHGLTAADFRLLVDGKEVPVEFFNEVVEGAAAGSTPQAAAGSPVGRNYLVYVDDSFSVAPSRNAVLEKVERDLGLLGPEDQMAVLAFDGATIDVLAGWTRDSAALSAALAKASQRPTRGNQQLAANRALANDEETAMGAGDPDLVALILDYLGRRISPEGRTQLGKAAPAAAAALRAFEVPPGRKVMLLLSGSWSLEVAGYLYGPMIEAANRLGYTVYPIEVGNSEPTAVTSFDGMARLTGGRALSAAGAAAFREVVEDTGSYYWLGFSPSWKANDRSHRVTVEMRRDGLKTRARSTFSDLSRQTANAMKSESVLLFGGQPEHKKLIVQLGEPKAFGRKAKEVDLVVTLGVPMDALALAPEGNGYRAQTPLAVAALDADGGRADLPGSTLRVLIQELPKGGGYARFQTRLRLRNTPQRLVFTVHDPVHGAALWGEAEFRPRG